MITQHSAILCSVKFLLRELSANPCCSIEHFADSVPLRIVGEEMRVFQQYRHLRDGEGADGFDAYGDVQHLRRYELPVPRAFDAGQFHKDAHVPGERTTFIPKSARLMTISQLDSFGNSLRPHKFHDSFALRGSYTLAFFCSSSIKIAFDLLHGTIFTIQSWWCTDSWIVRKFQWFWRGVRLCNVILPLCPCGSSTSSQFPSNSSSKPEMQDWRSRTKSPVRGVQTVVDPNVEDTWFITTHICVTAKFDQRYHAVEKVQRSQSNRLVLVVQAHHDEILVRLHTLRVCFEDFRHRQQSQVLHWKTELTCPAQHAHRFPISIPAAK